MTATVASMCTLVTSGGTPSRARPEFYVPGVVPWVKTMDLKDGPVAEFDEYISDDGLANSPARLLPGGTVLMAMYGATVGRLGWLREPAACNQAACAMVADSTVCDERWLYYALRWARPGLVGLASGAAQQNLNVGTIRSAVLPSVTLDEQRGTGEILRALDDKIAANARSAGAASELATALFDVAVARAERWTALGDVATVVLGGTPDRTRPEYWLDGTVPWIASGKANEQRVLRPSEWITEEALESSAAKIMPRRATILAITGATLGQVARLEIETSGNQSIVGVWHDEPAMNDWLHFAVRHRIGELLRHATGAAQQHVNKRAVTEMPVPVAPPEDVARWFDRARPLLDGAANADRESLVLSEVRDELLPLLMSGEVRAKDAEKAVGAVL